MAAGTRRGAKDSGVLVVVRVRYVFGASGSCLDFFYSQFQS
jgi:hypothetical protein